ncbi:hypothetical protein ACFW1F_36855 [Streptomyces bungoensis]|uniref:hypothetical protein n=1 Tax=Streptomyces bungoensis TaxID=285568 RepID=UPI00344AB8E0
MSARADDVVMVFGRDGALSVYPSLRAVEEGLPAAEVTDGGCAAFTVEGQVVDLLVQRGGGGPVVALCTGEDGRADLERRLARFWQRRAVPAADGGPPGPRATAALILDRGARLPGHREHRLTRFLRRLGAAARG